MKSWIEKMKTRIENKCIVIDHLDFLTIFIAIVARLFGVRVKFINMISLFKTESAVTQFNRLGIEWINYRKFPDDLAFKEEDEARRITERCFNDISRKSKTYLGIVKTLKMDSVVREKFDCAVKRELVTSSLGIRSNVKLVLFLEYLLAKEPGIEIWYICHIMSRLYYGYYKERKPDRIKFVLAPIFSNFYFITSLVVNVMARLIRKIVHYAENNIYGFVRKTKPEFNKAEAGRVKSYDLSEYKVIFFPHKGIFYGNLFIKDYYYSVDAGSPFSAQNIFHLSLEELDEKSSRYYAEKNIPHGNAYEMFPYKKIDFALNVSRYMLANIVNIVKDALVGIGPLEVSLLVCCYARLFWWDLFFKWFPSIRICIAGYDYMFPRLISTACRMNNIATFSVQERFNLVKHSPYFNFDYYGVCGEGTVELLSNSGLNSIGEYLICGMPRVDLLYQYSKTYPGLMKYERLRERHHLVLALDVHSPRTFVEDGFRDCGSRKVVKEFYERLINLVVAFPEIYVVIKGKEISSYRLNYLKKIVEKIHSLPNIEIELNLDKYTPYKLGVYADTVIAFYTSFADELIAAGKRVIFYDPIGYLRYFNFPYIEYNIVVSDYTELYQWMENILDRDEYIPESMLGLIRREMYGDCFDGKVKQRINDKLIQIYGSTAC